MNPWEHSIGHSVDQIHIKIGQNGMAKYQYFQQPSTPKQKRKTNAYHMNRQVEDYWSSDLLKAEEATK